MNTYNTSPWLPSYQNYDVIENHENPIDLKVFLCYGNDDIHAYIKKNVGSDRVIISILSSVSNNGKFPTLFKIEYEFESILESIKRADEHIFMVKLEHC